MTYLLLGVLAVSVISGFFRGRDMLSPSRIYVSIYAFILSIYFLNLSRLQTPWSFTTHCLFWGASGMFLVGGLWMWLAAKIKFPHWSLDFGRVRLVLREDAERVDWSWYGKVWIWCMSLFMLSFFVSYLIIGGIPMFMNNPDVSRIQFFTATTPTSYGIFLGPQAMMMGMVLFWFSNPGPRRRWVIIGGVLVTVMLYSTTVTRYDLFRFLIFSMVLFHYGKRRLSPSHLGFGILLAGILFFVGFLIRVQAGDVEVLSTMIEVKLPKNLMWTSSIYAYIANDFWNFDFAVQKFIDGPYSYPFQYGLGLFRPVMYHLRLEGLLAAYGFDSLMNESIVKLKGLNTVIYVWHLYKDFGYFGAFMLPFGAGLWLGRFYINTLMAPTVFRISIWGILAAGVILSYHTPLWEFWFVYFNLILLAIGHRKVRIFGGSPSPPPREPIASASALPA